MNPIATALLSILALAGATATAGAEPRVFTSKDGKEIVAEIVDVFGEKVTVRRTDKQTFTANISMFSKEDQEFIKEWQKLAVADKVPRLELKVSSGKKTRDTNAGDYDNQTERFEFAVTVTNEARFTVEKAKGTLLVLGRSVTESDELKVLSKDSFDFTIAPGESAVFRAKELANEFDNNYTAKFGHKYNGYLLVIQNANGKIVGTKGIPSTITNNAERGLALMAGGISKRDLTPKK